MEINTAEMFYKALVRAVFDYGSVIFFPRQESKRKGLERIAISRIKDGARLQDVHIN